MPATPFLTVEYSLSNSESTQPEKNKQIALQAISDMRGLFLVVANLTAKRIIEELAGTPEDRDISRSDVVEMERRVDVFDVGVRVLGALGDAIADAAYAAVEEIATAFSAKEAR